MAEIPEKIPGRRRLALAAAALLVLLQAAFFGGWIWREQSADGVTIVVETVPVDPRDLLRGQYFQLNYDFEIPSRFDSASVPEASLLPGETVYAALAADNKDRYFPKRYGNSLAKLRRTLAELYRFEDPFAGDPPRIVVIQGTTKTAGGRKYFDFGINRFFVPEGTPEPSRLAVIEVELRVTKDLTPQIRSVLVDGKPWPEPRRR